MPAVPESFLKWSPGLCAQGKAPRERTACIGMKVRNSRKDWCQILPLQGTNPGNDTGRGAARLEGDFWKGLGRLQGGQDTAVCLSTK